MITPGRAEANTTLDPQRLKYLTENFTGLQGLNFVALGAVLLLPLEDVYGEIRPDREWLQWLAYAVLIAVMGYIPRYYRRRFGWVEPVEPRNPSNKQFVIFLLVFLVGLFGGRSLGQRLDRYVDDLSQVIHSMIFDPTGQVKLLPLICWIAALFANLRKRSQRIGDPYRIYFLVFGTITFALIALYPLWHPEATQSLLWRTLNAGSLGFSLMGWGLYNHITLVRMLPKRFAENNDE